MRVPIEQLKDFAAEYKYGLVVEGNKQDLEACCISVDIDVAVNNCLGVERAVDK